ncbi:uncharacterized protein proser2 [Nelusetta ayraudi]|uniref:uncharacterized protein proser2 n=1 Tax=Nelusetta ayraudi TaxID=303726 RepID=UPI003F6F430F
MDLRLHSNPELRYGLNGEASRGPRPGEDDALQFLSREEQECLQFFEKTIDSLEESLEDNDQRAWPSVGTSDSSLEVAEGPVASSPCSALTLSSANARLPSPKDQDIIDLVRPEPDLVQTKKSVFNPVTPDFHSMMPTPESHFEIKPRHDPMDGTSSEYNPPLPGGSFGGTGSPSLYHPPGCIPTPVLIAQKIAENQAGEAVNTQSTSLQHRSSLEPEIPSSPGTDHPVKQAPSTSAKPTRFPANISLVLGNRDHQNHSVSNVSIEERRMQMLANLSGSHPLLQHEHVQPLEETSRNIPRRSISFKDPTPDKSRMEALSKLGLTRNRAMSGGLSLLASPSSSSSLDAPPSVETSSKPLETIVSPSIEPSAKLPEVNTATLPLPNQNTIERKSEVQRKESLKSLKETKSPPLSPLPSPPPPIPQMSSSLPPQETKAPVSPTPEVTSLEFNLYGGKSVVVKPSVSSRGNPPTSPTSYGTNVSPPTLANPPVLNTYGGKTKVVNPKKSDLPDILSSHIDKSRSLPANPAPHHTELNSYGGKSRTIRPPDSSITAAKTKAPPPVTAPRPPRHSYHGPLTTTTHKAAQRASSPEHKRRPASMFRPQGITVQFAGRGGSDESRRDALRKLGLLNDF